MLYPKNVPNIERVLRILLGVVLVGIALFGQSVIGQMSPLVVALLIFSALFVIITGFIGWCPACALLGRKLKNQNH
ncbi:MAG: DUF2892 domain-containing protein [Anaerolineae bacterium]|nr:DUF2892 domain-containing protein [Anaerolineae bacterium]